MHHLLFYDLFVICIVTVRARYREFLLTDSAHNLSSQWTCRRRSRGGPWTGARRWHTSARATTADESSSCISTLQPVLDTCLTIWCTCRKTRCDIHNVYMHITAQASECPIIISHIVYVYDSSNACVFRMSLHTCTHRFIVYVGLCLYGSRLIRSITCSRRSVCCTCTPTSRRRTSV